MKTYADRKQYASFVKLLKREGFSLMQKSVYIKFCVSTLSLETQSKRIQQFTPSNIQVVVLSVPEKTFTSGVYFNCQVPRLLKNKSIICI